MSFLRIRQLKQALSLCHTCIRLTTTQIHVAPKYTLLTSHVNRSFSARSVVDQIRDRGEKVSTMNTEDKNIRNLDNLLNILSEYSTTRQRIDIQDVEKVVTILKNNSDIVLSYNDALLLLRCCGKYIPKEHASDRTKMLNAVWEKIQESGCKISVTHYNARLLAMLENDEPFLVHEELAAIDNRGIRANRTTYQIMIDKLCRDGDVFVANEIKKHMEELGMPVTNVVYLSFIKANIQSGNLEEVKNVIEIMMDAGYKMDARAYRAMIEAYALNGDLEGIKKLIAEAGEHGVNLDVNEMRGGFVNLCKIGQEEKAMQLAELMPARGGVAQSLVNCMLEALALGCNDAALQIYRKSEPSFPNMTSNAIIMKQISNGTPARAVMETWNELKGMDRLASDFDELVLLSIHVGTAEQMLDFIDLMHEKGKPIWGHFFSPAIKRYAREHNLEGMSKVFGRMLTLSGDLLDPVPYIVIHHYADLEQFPAEDRVTVLKNTGLSAPDLDKFTIYNHLMSGEVKEALKLRRQNNVRLPPLLLKSWLSFKMQSCDDYTSAIDLLSESCLVPSRLVNSLLLSTMAQDRSMPIGELEEALQYFISKMMVIMSNERKFRQIKSDLEWKGISPKLIEQLEVLQQVDSGKDSNSTKTMPETWKMYNGPEMEDQRKKLQADVHFLQNQAELFNLCKENRREEALELKKLIESEGHHLGSKPLAMLGSMEARTGNLDEAMKYKNLLDMRNETFNFTGLAFKISELLIKQNRLDEAILLLEEHADSGKVFRLDNNALNITSVIDACAKVNDFATMQKLVSILMQYTEKSTPHLIYMPLTKAYANKKDPRDIVDVMKFCKEKFNQIYGFTRTMEFLIELEDAQNLQKVVDMVAEVLGENEAVHHLIVILAQKGRLEEARKLSQTPGIKADNHMFSNICGRLIKHQKAEEMENIVAAIKDMKGLNRDDMLFYLIRMHCRNNHFHKAVEVLEQYKEEKVKPTNRTLRYLGKVLKNEKLPIPFDVPWHQDQVEYQRSDTKPDTAKSADMDFLSLDEIVSLRETASEELKRYEQKLETSEPASLRKRENLLFLNILRGDFEKATDLLQAHRKLRTSSRIRPLVEKLYNLGDMESLEKLVNLLKHMQTCHPSEKYRSNLFICYTNLIELTVGNRDIDKCTELYKEARENKIKPKISPAMKSLYAEFNRELPLKNDEQKLDNVNSEISKEEDKSSL